MENEKKPKEKPWRIHSWSEYREALARMKPRSKLFETTKTEFIKRGHWKKHSPHHTRLDDN